MKYETILYEKQGAVAKVVTNRPRYKNAQSRLMIEEMNHAFSAARASVTLSAMRIRTIYIVHGLDSHTKDKLAGKGFPKVMPGVAKALKARKK
jgi:1,4-dihydroxy-2-naphthoyl-CoA synthase